MFQTVAEEDDEVVAEVMIEEGEAEVEVMKGVGEDVVEVMTDEDDKILTKHRILNVSPNFDRRGAYQRPKFVNFFNLVKFQGV